MPFCPNCGSQVAAGDRFCANCGTPVQPVTMPVAQVVNNVGTDARTDYRIVLVSRGTCPRAAAIDMLSDLLGYSDADAALIIDNAPMEAALGLTAIQTQYISQAITEYGMQVAIYNSDGYVDMGSRATSSVYDADGDFLSAVAGVLTGLTVGNRVSNFSPWTRPAPVVFRTSYRRAAPLPGYRRRRPAPTPIPVVRHSPPPIPRPIPEPRPRPVPARSVEGSRPMPVHPAPTPTPRPAPVRPAPVRPAPTGPVTTPRSAPHPVPGRPASTGPVTTPRSAPGPQRGPGGTGRGGRGGSGGPMGPGGGRRG